MDDTLRNPSTPLLAPAPDAASASSSSRQHGNYHPPPFGRWILLITAVLKFISPIVFPFSGSTTDPPITPPGVFFSIWGVITTGCLAAALWGVPARRAAVAPYRHVQLPLSVTQVLFVCWLAAATSSPPGNEDAGYRFLTLPIFIGMLATVSMALAAVQRTAMAATPASSDNVVTFALLSTVLGLYAGWSTPAIWLNLGALLPPGLLTGANATAWQVGLAGAAVVSVVAGSYLSNANVGYTLASAWALTGVLISSMREDLVPVAVTAGTGLALLGVRLRGLLGFHFILGTDTEPPVVTEQCGQPSRLGK